MSELSLMIRRMFKEGDDLRDVGLTTPQDILRYDDILYGDDPVWQRLDVYRPKNQKGSLPVIVSVHGGGWVYGDKERYQYYCMALAQHGYAVVNFTYRLAPEFQFPAPLEDTNLVFWWVLSHADEYGFDRNNVFAVGDSAGAHLLGLYTGICTDPDYAAQFDFGPPEGFVPRAIGLHCGAYALDTSDPKDMNTQLMEDFLPGGVTPEGMEKTNVLSRISPSFPPVFFMTCNGDFLRDQAGLLMNALEKNNVPFVYRFYGDRDHELGHVFHLNIRSEAAIRCNREVCVFFRTECV